ncbi:hypothetical protein ACLOJK_028776 [Asimina triloba]
MSEKQLITPKDLNVIRESYSISSSIVLSVPAAHETPRDNRPWYLYPNEYMLGAGVRIPFDFRIAEALWAFNVPSTCVIPHSLKVIQTMAWYCEHRGCMADQYLSKKGDNWGVPERWEDSLPDPIPRSRLSLPTSQRWALMYFRGTTLHWHSSREEFFHWCESTHFVVVKEGERRTLKRVHPSKEEGNLADFDSSIERAPGIGGDGSAFGDGLAQGVGGVSCRGGSAPIDALRFVARPSAVVEYLQSDAYHRRMEFEQAHHSLSGYVRARSDVAALYPEMDLSSLYRIAHVGGFPALG